MNLDTRLERAIAELGEHVDADAVFEEVRRKVNSRHRKAVASRVLTVALALTVAAGGAYAVTRAIGPRASTTGGGASVAQDNIVLVQTVPNLGPYTDSEIYVMSIQTKTTRKLVSRSVRAVATGTADDEPERLELLSQLREVAHEDPDVVVLELPAEAHRQINALQRAATIVLQKSVRGGFDLGPAGRHSCRRAGLFPSPAIC